MSEALPKDEQVKAEEYLANLMRSGAEAKTYTQEVSATPAEEARAAAIEAIKAMGGAAPVMETETRVERTPHIELETTRDLDKITAEVGTVAGPAPDIAAFEAATASIQEKIVEAPVSEISVATGPETTSKTAPSQQVWMEQLQQQPQSRDTRPSAIITTTYTEVPKPLPVANEISVPVVESMPSADTPVNEEAAFTAPQYGAANTEALRAMQEEMDATPSADIQVSPEVAIPVEPTPVQPNEMEPVTAPPVAEVSVDAPVVETPVVEESPAESVTSSPSPTEVEAMLTKGEAVVIPDVAPVESAPVPVEEVVPAVAPTEAEVAPLRRVEPRTVHKENVVLKTSAEVIGKVGKSAAEKIEVVRKKGAESARDTAIGMREGFGKLAEDTKKFVRRLYLTGPVGAVLGAKWRASFMFNDALVRFYGSRARSHRLDRVTSERKLLGHLRAQREDAQSLAEVAAIGGNEVLPKDIAQQALANHQARDKAETYYGLSAAAAGKKEQYWGTRGEKFMERRDAALSKMERRTAELLEVVGEKTEKVEKERNHFDELTVPFANRVEAFKLRAAQLAFKYEEAAAAGKITSPEAKKLMARNMEASKEALAQAEQVLGTRTHGRGQLEQQLKELGDKIALLNSDQARDKKLAESKYARTIRNENDTTMPEYKWQQEIVEDESESIPPLSAEEYVRNWNWFFGSDARINPSDFKKVSGAEGIDTMKVEEWDKKFVIYMSAQHKDVPRKKVVTQLSTMRSLAASLSAPKYLSRN